MSQNLDPVIILIRPQLGDNIGMAARAMLNFGLTQLRLVNPRTGWDETLALASSAGADKVIMERQEFANTADALADLHYVIATTARPRDMVKPVLTPEKAAQELRAHAAQGLRCGVLYGRESSGLDNDDISFANAICTVPVNPAFSSLNLAQAVLLMTYIWYQAGDETVPLRPVLPNTRPASRAELTAMLAHLEAALEAAGFLSPAEKKPAMVRNIRNMLLRADMTEQDVRTFRGMINTLLRWPRDDRDSDMRRRVLAISSGKGDPSSDKDAPQKCAPAAQKKD
ncbi:MAG: RNA methyltransferase [Alphaproteobacteria bacterium]|nr:RNA methyltransferase [Alphaproteobacteria bacterium]